MTRDEARILYYELHKDEVKALKRQAPEARNRQLEVRRELFG